MAITFYVDHREHKIYAIIAQLDYAIEKRQNKYGDIEIEKDGKLITVIERKEIHDLENSMISGHFDDQFERSSHYCWKNEIFLVLAVHGNVDDYIAEEKRRRNRIPNKNAIHAAVSSCLVRYGATVIWIEQCKDLVKMVMYIAKKIAEDKLFKQRRILIRSNKGYPQNVVRLHRLLGVSLKLSERLIKEYGGVRKVLQAPDESLLSIKGVGQAILKRIKKVLD